MKEALKTLKKEQIDFICTECNISEDDLFALSEDDLYDRVYEVMCDIELEEIPDSGETESERCILASGIVTVLGNALAKAAGWMDDEEEDS